MSLTKHKLPCYVFDIDGTISNGHHRFSRPDQHKHGPYNELLCHLDPPHAHICGLASDLLAAGRPLVFTTGRTEAVRQQTEIYLSNHISQWWGHRLYMRQIGDRRPDEIVKSEMLDCIIERGFKPLMVFDDRNSVVAMWRAAGIPCAQVAEGNF